MQNTCVISRMLKLSILETSFLLNRNGGIRWKIIDEISMWVAMWDKSVKCLFWDTQVEVCELFVR